jgi:hypothetical protein
MERTKSGDSAEQDDDAKVPDFAALNPGYAVNPATPERRTFERW